MKRYAVLSRESRKYYSKNPHPKPNPKPRQNKEYTTNNVKQ